MQYETRWHCEQTPILALEMPQLAHCLRRTGGGDWGAEKRGEGVNDGVVEGTVVGGTTATEDDTDEGAAEDAARGEGAVGETLADRSREEECDDDNVGDETVAFLALRFAAAAASLALILIGALQVKHIFRRDMVQFMIFALRLWS